MKYILKITLLLMTITALAQKPMPVNTDSVYQTIKFGFSQAVQHQQLIFTSGQVGWDQKYQLPVDADFGAQTKLAFKNIQRILKEGQSDLRHIIHMRIYIVNLGIYEREVISKLLKTHYSGAYQPATTLLGISALARPNLRIEIEVIATTTNDKP